MNATDPTGRWLDRIGERHTPTPPPPSFTNSGSNRDSSLPFATPSPLFRNPNGSSGAANPFDSWGFPSPQLSPAGPYINQQQANSGYKLNLPQVSLPSVDIRDPDYTTIAGTIALPNAVTGKAVGVAFGLTADKYSNHYVTVGVSIGVGRYPVGGNISGGWILQENRSESAMRNFFNGASLNLGGGGGPGGAINLSGFNNPALETGVYTSNAGAAVSFTFLEIRNDGQLVLHIPGLN